MSNKTLLILERSGENLTKMSKTGKIVLEGVFAQFGTENRNGRIYEEKVYLPHIQYLKEDISKGALLGELDHPERFEVSLSNVSHKITDIWYDQAKRQLKGRLEILEGTPKGAIAKALLEAGVNLSISSRAAGTVNENKTVEIQQIYTYDLVAKPGFAEAQLDQVNESFNPKVNAMIKKLNESFTNFEKDDISKSLGFVNENLSIIDLSGKGPSAVIREEAMALQSKNNNDNMSAENDQKLQEWTVRFNEEIGNINKRLDEISKPGSKINESSDVEIKGIKKYIESLRKIQEESLNWQSEIAKAVNEHTVIVEGNQKDVKKLAKTIDHNAIALNKTQDWVSKNAKVTNAIAESVDHNADMLNKLNEWTETIAITTNKLNEWGEEKAIAINKLNEWNEGIARSVNKLNEWGEEKAKAVNDLHEWVSSIAKNFNNTANWSEEQMGKTLSKAEAKEIVAYMEELSESRFDPELKAKINEMLVTNSITETKMNESNCKIKGICVIDTTQKAGNTKVTDLEDGTTDVKFNEKTKTIFAKMKAIQLKKNAAIKGIKTLDGDHKEIAFSKNNLDLKTINQTKVIPQAQTTGHAKVDVKNQNLKLNTKPMNEGFTPADIKDKKVNLDAKLTLIMENLEKQRVIDEQVRASFPFTQLLAESERKRFTTLSASDKQKVASNVSAHPTTDSNTIMKLWENALTNVVSTDEPLWLSAAPVNYKQAYNTAGKQLQESLQARSEYFKLETQYQINNFWEKSGIISTPLSSINESVITKPAGENAVNVDAYVQAIGEKMKTYRQ
jgi:hypothetical protein